jgi:hypothetical protein
VSEVNAMIAKAVNDAQGIPDAEESTSAKYASKSGDIRLVHTLSLA